MEAKNKKDHLSLLEELKTNPYHSLNTAFALMAIIPMLIFLYILVVNLFSLSILYGSVGLLFSFALIISVTGYFLTHDTITDILVHIFRYRHSAISKSKLIAVVAHDMKNPLSAIMGNLEIVLSEMHGPLTPQQERSLSMCFSMCERLRTLVDSLQGTYRAKKKSEEFTRQLFSLTDLLETQEKEIRLQVEMKHIKLTTEFVGTDFLMWGMEEKIAQAVHNLLTNAAKFTPSGGEIIIMLTEQEEIVRLEVSNSGPHIPHTELESIFEHYKRLDTDEEGVGLGLAIAKDIVEMHDGNVWAESEPGIGNKFIVELPRDLREEGL